MPQITNMIGLHLVPKQNQHLLHIIRPNPDPETRNGRHVIHKNFETYCPPQKAYFSDIAQKKWLLIENVLITCVWSYLYQ